jgi:hypothetical protein
VNFVMADSRGSVRWENVVVTLHDDEHHGRPAENRVDGGRGEEAVLCVGWGAEIRMQVRGICDERQKFK